MLSSSMASKVKDIVCNTLEIDEADLNSDDNFQEVHGADSLRMIEVLAGLERELKIKMDQSDLAKMTDLDAVMHIVEGYLVPAM